MPLLFALGQHPALEAVQRHLADGDLDDIYFVTVAERTGIVYSLLQNALRNMAGIRIHHGKTKVWNNAGEQPAACEVLDRMARAADPSVTTSVWRGSDVPRSQQGTKVLGTNLGHNAFVRAHLERTSGEHQTLLDRILMVSDLQSSWLLLVHSASARANYISRVVEPEAAEDFCRRHDAGLWRCFCACMQIDPDQSQDVMDTATMPLALGGLGLRSAIRGSAPAYWPSWADCLSMIHKCHTTASAALVRAHEGQPDIPFLKAASQCQRELTGRMDFVPPSWEDLARGAMPPQRETEDREPETTHRGWQHEASMRVEGEFQQLFSRTSAQIQALIRSQAGLGAGAAFTVTPTNRETTIPSHLFRVVVLRRLRQVLPLSARSCRCGRPLDPCGHHRVACAEAGMLGRRYALESIMARICREAGGRVRTNLIRDMNVPAPNALDGRRLEVVVDGLPVRSGARWPLTPLWCVVAPRWHATTASGHA